MTFFFKTIGEALGAIGHPDVVPILEKYLHDPVVEVAETCEIALDRLKWFLAEKCGKQIKNENPYASIGKIIIQ